MNYDLLTPLQYAARIGYAMIPVLIIIAVITIFLIILMAGVRKRGKNEGISETTDSKIKAEIKIKIESQVIEIKYLRQDVERLIIENQEFKAIRKRNLATWGE